MATPRTLVTLGDLIEIKHGWPFKSELFSEDLTGKPIVVNIGNFRYTGGFRFDTTTLKEYRGAYPKEYELVPGDILVIMTCQTAGGEILGIPGRIPSDGRTYLHNQRMGKVVVKCSDAVDPGFLYYLFMSPDLNRELAVTASGTKILHTSPSRIEAFGFKLPQASEQRAIAAVLGTLDDKIELNRRMNETLEATAQAIFRSWFVDFEPVRAKAAGRKPAGMSAEVAALYPRRLVKSGAKLLPDGWTSKPLDSIADFLNGLALQKFPPRGTGDLPVIKIAELRRGDTEGSDLAGKHVPPEYIVHDGDVLFSWSGSLEVVIWCGGKGALNQHLFKVTSSKYPKWFYFHWIKEHLRGFQAIAAAKATTMGHIQRHHLSEALVIVPSEPILKATRTIVEPLVDRVVANNLESRTLHTLRDTLLPKLLSGEVRVKQAEKMMEASL